MYKWNNRQRGEQNNLAAMIEARCVGVKLAKAKYPGPKVGVKRWEQAVGPVLSCAMETTSLPEQWLLRPAPFRNHTAIGFDRDGSWCQIIHIETMRRAKAKAGDEDCGTDEPL